MPVSLVVSMILICTPSYAGEGASVDVSGTLLLWMALSHKVCRRAIWKPALARKAGSCRTT